MSILYWINIIWILCPSCTAAERQDLCIGEVFKAKCTGNNVIVIDKALYGRMMIGKCVKEDLGHLGCHNDVQAVLDSLCSGQESCEMFVPNEDLKNQNRNCRSGLELYLDVQYSCLKVARERDLCSQGSKLKIHQPHGYIASHVVDTARCGSSGSPWRFEAEPGQTIEMWLMDFGPAGREYDAKYTTCIDILGFVSEKLIGVNQTLCSGDTRRSLIYSSKTNQLELMLLRNRARRSHFVIEYKFTGCSELAVPNYKWYKRNGHTAQIGCKSDDRKWVLTCNDGLWEGNVGNCSVLQERTMVAATTDDKSNLSFSSVILLTGVVCAAVLLIIIVVVAGTVYIKKQSIKHGVQLRSEYGVATLPTNLFSTNKNPGYDTNTLKSQMTSSCPNQAADDSQPLVHIWERTLPDPTRTASQGYPGTMTSVSRTSSNDATISPHGDLLH